jgi:hypothetical protein
LNNLKLMHKIFPTYRNCTSLEVHNDVVGN